MLQTHADVQVISSKMQRNLTQATRACFRHYEDNKPLFLFLLRLNQKVCWHGFLQDLWVCLWSCPLSSFHCAASTWVGPMASFSSFSMSSSLSLHFLQSLARFVLRRPDAAAGLKNYNYNYLCTIFFFLQESAVTFVPLDYYAQSSCGWIMKSGKQSLLREDWNDSHCAFCNLKHWIVSINYWSKC